MLTYDRSMQPAAQPGLVASLGLVTRLQLLHFALCKGHPPPGPGREGLLLCGAEEGSFYRFAWILGGLLLLPFCSQTAELLPYPHPMLFALSVGGFNWP